MRNAVFAALAAAALLPVLSNAAPTVEDFDLRTAEDLVDLCAVPDGDPMVEAARGFCYGFLSGAGSYHRSVNAGKKAHPLFCLPEQRMSRAEGSKLFVDWARAHPQYLSEAPVDALVRFAVATWPCKQAK
jgi:hypothetical protein